LHEFGEEAILRLKINMAYSFYGWDINKEIEKLNLPKTRNNLMVTTDSVDYKFMPRFYAMGNIFVSPTMGEAFSIPCAEAMAMGLPVITTNFGGQTDFVTKENGYLIDYELVEVKHDVAYEGIRWAKPNIKQLREVMRHAFENPAEVIKKGKIARKDIEKFTWERSAKKLLSVLNENS